VRSHSRLSALAAIAGLALASAAHAQLGVQVVPRAVDEDDPQCFLHGTLSTQDVDVTNPGAAPVLATLDCRVPGDLLRVAAKTPPRSIAPGATERMNCSLYDFQDPPADGAVVPFEVDVNGQVSSHDVPVSCRATGGPGARCAAARLGAAASACRSQVQALAGYAVNGDMDALETKVGRAAERLARRFGRAELRGEGACPAEGGLAEAAGLFAETGELLLEFVGAGNTGACGAAKLRALARKCQGDLAAWGRLARRGAPDRLERSLARSDAGFEKRYARALGDACASAGERDWLRRLLDEASGELAAAEGLTLGPRHAELLGPVVAFAPGEREKRLWLPAPGMSELLFERAPDLHAVAIDGEGDSFGVAGELESPDVPGATLLQFPAPAEHANVLLIRSGDLRRARSVPVALGVRDPAFAAGTLVFDAMLYSPLRSFPDGAEVAELPPGVPLSFGDWVRAIWSYDPEEGLPALAWLPLSDLLLGSWPAAAPAVSWPPGAQHNQNECGISTFIHSFETKFPGALAADVTTNPQKWDAVADTIGHTNLLGNAGTTMVTYVNAAMSGTFGQLQGMPTATPSKTLDGKFYCAGRIFDRSPANLAAWSEDCNLRIVFFDIEVDFWNSFAHWVDVNQVTPDPMDATKATFAVQDYGVAFGAGYDSAGNDLDFGVDPATATSVTARNFTGGNTVCGDSADEFVGFYVVCECDRTNPDFPILPRMTKSGKPLATF
jgi:hypothetical protein